MGQTWKVSETFATWLINDAPPSEGELRDSLMLVSGTPRVDELIDTVGLLKNENTSLRQQKDKLVSERSQLIEKTELARSRVEAMISRLRSLELGS